MVAESLDIVRATYFVIVMLDRSYQGPVMVGSPAGGVDIEEVAATTPEKTFKVGREGGGKERGREEERGREKNDCDHFFLADSCRCHDRSD